MTGSESRKRNARRLRWALLLLLSAGCGSGGPSRPAREELSRISRAIDALRSADNAHKAQFVPPLRSAGCAEFCGLRDRCLAAYETHLRGLELIKQARTRRVLDARELDAAERTLNQARGLVTECASEQAKLVRQLSL